MHHVVIVMLVLVLLAPAAAVVPRVVPAPLPPPAAGAKRSHLRSERHAALRDPRCLQARTLLHGVSGGSEVCLVELLWPGRKPSHPSRAFIAHTWRAQN